MTPRFSVIIPTLHCPSSLEQCLSAIHSQSLPPQTYEVIVVINQKDLDPPYFKEYPKVKWLRENRFGSYCARNLGVKNSEASFLAFTDDDCIPEGRWLENALREFEENAGKNSILAGQIQVTLSPFPSSTEIYESVFSFDQEHYAKAQKFAATANMLCSRKTFQQVGPFVDELLSGGDFEWGQRAHQKGFPVRFCPTVNVSHPARKTFPDLCEKALRVKEGRRLVKNRYGGKDSTLTKLRQRKRVAEKMRQVILNEGLFPLFRAFVVFIRLRWWEFRSPA